MDMGQPIIFVSANHRLNASGTLTSQEITDAGVSNLLLKDQRWVVAFRLNSRSFQLMGISVAMQWIQKYIRGSGGDPSRATLFGESAGSLAIATHLVLNDGDNEGLFSSAIGNHLLLNKLLAFSDLHRTGRGSRQGTCVDLAPFGRFLNCALVFFFFFFSLSNKYLYQTECF